MGSTPSVPRVDIEDVTAALGEVLGVADETLDTDTPLIELGLESFTAVRLRRRLREDFGLELPLAAFLGAATISSVAHGITDPGTGDQERNGDPGDGSFPLTPIQSAYWVGRDPAFPLGGVATFFYREYDRVPAQRAEDDLANLSEAWNRLVLRHPMLRMVVGPDARQRVLDSVPRYEIAVTDLRNRTIDAAEREAEELRHAWSHQVRPADTWPLFDLRAVLLPDGRTRLCLGIDVLAVDFAGWLHLLAEWGTVAADPAAELPGQATTFADIVRQRASDPGERARRDADLAYWTSRVPTLPPEPALPLAADVTELRGHRFTRTAERLSPDEWKALRARAADHGLSPTGVLLAAFGLTLHRWGATDPFCLNVTLFDRPDEPEAAGVVGDFTSTVLVELPDTDPAGWAGFAEYATRANRRFWTDLEHRSVSGMEALRAAGHVDTTPRYPVVFTSGLGLSDGDDPAGWLGEEVFGISQTPQVLLDHIVYPEAGGLTLCWDSVEGAFADGFVDGMLAAHTRLLRTLASEPAAWTDTTLGWNPSYHADEPLDVEPFGDVGPLLPDPWHAAAERHPDRPALLGDTGAWSHRELRVSAARLGSVLTGYGVGPGDLVAVSAEKGPEQVVAILGVSASGAGYVPVEPSWPAGRVASVCEQAGIRHAVLGADVTVEWPAEITRHRLASDGTIAGEPSEVPPTAPEPGELAYVIFTSGSTGKPKGVAIEHRAARTTIDDLVDRFPLNADDRMLALSAFSFDLSVHDIFGVLGAGGALVLPDAERQRDPAHWLELMRRHGVTLWNTAPALMEMLVEYAEVDPRLAREAFASLRLVFLSADWIPVTLPDRVRTLAPEAQIVSLGGATEASIWSICHPIGEVDPAWRSVPYGRALRGQSFHILDSRGGPCPVGEAGELHIGGGGLARGYIGDPGQTAERFITHPMLGRLYRTGDMGRWRPDGTIEFLGRLDRQVKIRGHRIELGEVESVLDRLPGVRKSVALSVPGPDERPRLVGYVVGHGGAAPDDEQLRKQLRAHVPEYMVPSRFVPMPEFPVTANGKIDYKALPNPYSRSDGESRAGAPASPPGGAPQATPVSDVDEGDELSARLRDARACGLEVTITLRPGTLDPLDAVAAAGEHGRRLQQAATESGLRPRPGFREEALLELVLDIDSGATADLPGSVDSGGTAAVPAAEPAPAEVPPAAAQPPAVVDGAALRNAETAVRRVLGDLLHTDVDPTTPFFQLGATSLTLVQAQRLLSAELDPDLTVVDMLANPTASGLAAVIANRAPSTADTGTPVGPPSPPGPTERPPRRGRGQARARAKELAR